MGLRRRCRQPGNRGGRLRDGDPIPCAYSYTNTNAHRHPNTYTRSYLTPSHTPARLPARRRFAPIWPQLADQSRL